jgi:hypothetical protein
LGRHQWELAIAFFLLGGDASTALSVCAKNLQDEQLALVICRLVEGSGGPLERNLISNVLLPGAVEKGDHWLSSLLEVCYMSALFFVFPFFKSKYFITSLKWILSFLTRFHLNFHSSVDARELFSVCQEIIWLPSQVTV